jgi:uncharacterized membrane protein YvlD (DUF360 family)
MPRFVTRALIELLAAAIGLLVAVWLLPGFSISFRSFVIVVVIFTVARFALEPLLKGLSTRYAQALVGGIALVATFAALLVTTLVSSGLEITGLSTWVLATLIVWIFDVIALLILPRVISSGAVSARLGRKPVTPAEPPGTNPQQGPGTGPQN